MNESKIKSTIKGAIRKAWTYYSEERQQAIEAATVRTPIKDKDGNNSGRFSSFVRCAMCDGLFKKSVINVDHINPVGKGFGWPPGPDLIAWIKTLWCAVDNLQVLCPTCHKKKSAKERKDGKYR